MGETIRRGTAIRDFEPDNTADVLYLRADAYGTLYDVLKAAQNKWGPHSGIEKIKIHAEHIHTECLGYDRYDPSDYTDYIVLTRIE